MTDAVRTEPPPTSLNLEDIVIGERWQTRSHTVGAAEIAGFGTLILDEHPLHTDPEYCRSRGFPGIIAHGLFGLALMEGLKTGLHLYDSTSIASLGWSKVRFLRPLLAGDAVHLRFRFLAARRSRSGDRGVVTEALELVNDRNEVVIDAEHAGLLQARTTCTIFADPTLSAAASNRE